MKGPTKLKLSERTQIAEIKFGPFASSHEAMGVALEEWDEFRERIHKNDINGAKSEALDLASVLIRFAEQEHFPRG